MSALSDKGITLEGLAAAVDSLRQELATWKALAHKQDQLSADQITATQSGATAAKISQIAVNTAAIQSLAAQVAGQISLAYVTTLPATGEPLTLYLVPQGDGTAPNYCNEYLWINNDWELIGTTGAMANNGELSIQVNGVAVGTFTANQAANAAVNIAVPTNTNQLVNGAGYVDTAALQAALLLKQNSLNAAQLEAVNSGITAAGVRQIADNTTAIAGKQDALTAAQQAAVDSGATVAKIDQIASNASAIASLTSGKQDQLSTTQLAAVNSGVTAAAVQQIGTNASNISGLQTAVASKAADSEVVHLAGAETIPGDKTWTGANTFTRINIFENIYDKVQSTAFDVRTDPETNRGGDLFRIWDGTASARGNYLGGISFYQNTDGSTRLQLICFGYPQTGNARQNRINFHSFRDGSAFFNPGDNGNINLGSSTNKWKSLNGINPGALSLPDYDRYVDKTSEIPAASLDGNTEIDINDYFPNLTGWINIVISDTSGNFIRAVQGKAGTATGFNNSRSFHAGSTGGGFITLFMPIVAGTWKSMKIQASSVTQFRFYPCQGNV